MLDEFGVPDYSESDDPQVALDKAVEFVLSSIPQDEKYDAALDRAPEHIEKLGSQATDAWRKLTAAVKDFSLSDMSLTTADEDNPMLGFRGASRYYSERYKEGFSLECQAIKIAREEIGMSNVVVMIPFCRTPEEADKILEVMEENGLTRGEKGLQIYVMCEIPSNVILADEFGKRFDGFSIGSNDLTQLILGVDRDSEELSDLFDEQNEAIKRAVHDLIKTAHKSDVKVGICGQAPSDHPDFAEFLVDAGIDSISLNPDSVVTVKKRVAKKEKKREKKG